jgi:hypothetical protein
MELSQVTVVVMAVVLLVQVTKAVAEVALEVTQVTDQAPQ